MCAKGFAITASVVQRYINMSVSTNQNEINKHLVCNLQPQSVKEVHSINKLSACVSVNLMRQLGDPRHGTHEVDSMHSCDAYVVGTAVDSFNPWQESAGHPLELNYAAARETTNGGVR